MSPDDAPSLGFDAFFADQLECLGEPALVPARVVADTAGDYRLRGCRASRGKLRGRLLHELAPDERPVVGDWVAVVDGGDVAIIHHVFDRRTVLVRRSAGTSTGVQTIAANVDVFFIVTSADRDFNVRRLERYLAAVWDSGADPVVVLNKIDLGSDVESMVDEIQAVAIAVPVVCMSAATGNGMDDLRTHLERGRTVGLIGSSGVGKSTIVNQLLGETVQATRSVRADGKGRHATTRRELIELPGGALLVDTPGMREFGLSSDDGGVDTTFADIAALAADCRFRDCRHQGEPGCAVEAAVETGQLDRARLDSYHKLQREIAAIERRRDPTHAGRPKRRHKWISKARRELKRRDRS